MRGLFRYPVQMCQLHQMMIVRRYLTNIPELHDPQEITGIARAISHIDKKNVHKRTGNYSAED